MSIHYSFLASISHCTSYSTSDIVSKIVEGLCSS